MHLMYVMFHIHCGTSAGFTQRAMAATLGNQRTANLGLREAGRSSAVRRGDLLSQARLTQPGVVLKFVQSGPLLGGLVETAQ